MEKLNTYKINQMLEKVLDAVGELESCVDGSGDAPLAFIANQVASVQQILATHENQNAEPTEGEEYRCTCGRVHVVSGGVEVVECGCGLVSYWDADIKLWEVVAESMCGM